MSRRFSAVIGVLVLVATSIFGASTASAAPPSAGPLAPAPSTQAPGPFCVDYLSKDIGPDGNSVTVASACSDLSIDIARTQARAAVVKKASQAGMSATPLTEWVLIRLYNNPGWTSLQREILGTAGPCDGAGYTFGAFPGDPPRLSSSRGYNGCNAVRLRNLQGQYSYLFQPANWLTAWDNNTNQYHPYCANPSTGLPC